MTLFYSIHLSNPFEFYASSNISFLAGGFELEVSKLRSKGLIKCEHFCVFVDEEIKYSLVRLNS